jgi:hypothetical protein
VASLHSPHPIAVEFIPYAHLLTPLDNGAYWLVVCYLQRHHRLLGRAAEAGDIRDALDDAFLHVEMLRVKP